MSALRLFCFIVSRSSGELMARSIGSDEFCFCDNTTLSSSISIPLLPDVSTTAVSPKAAAGIMPDAIIIAKTVEAAPLDTMSFLRSMFLSDTSFLPVKPSAACFILLTKRAEAGIALPCFSTTLPSALCWLRSSALPSARFVELAKPPLIDLLTSSSGLAGSRHFSLSGATARHTRRASSPSIQSL